MKAPKFVVLVAADEVYFAPSEFTIEMEQREFSTFAAAWKFVNSREFTLAFSKFIDKASAQFDRPLVQGSIMLQGLHCATFEAYCAVAQYDAYSEWTRHWEI